MNEMLSESFKPAVQGLTNPGPSPALMKNVTCIEDLRLAARRRVPRAFFGYAEAGSYSEQTLRANRSELERIQAAPACAGQHCEPGYQYDDPWRDGSTADCPSADRHWRSPMGERRDPRLPRRPGSGHPRYARNVVDLLHRRRCGRGREAFLVPALRHEGRGFARSLVERAIAAKCSALVLTVDLQVPGQRHIDIKNGLSVPPSLNSRTSST